MPKKTTKPPRHMRAAVAAYGGMLGLRGHALEVEQESWDDNELFIVAHLAYCQLLQSEAIRQQNDTIIALLRKIAEDTRDIADIAEELGGEDSSDEDEDGSDEDDGGDDIEDADDSEAEVVELPVHPARGRSALLEHPEPPDGAA